MRLDIFDRWGGHVYQDEYEAPISAQSGLVGDEVYWDGFVRCGFDGGLCDNNPCNTGDICYSNGEPVVHQSGVYVYMLTVRSCTTRAPNCQNDPDPCNSDFGEYCSSNGDNSEVVIASDVTIVL